MMDDLISRQAAIDAVSGGMCSGWDCDVIDKLKALPSVQPKERCIATITLSEEDLERIVKERVEEIKTSLGIITCKDCKWWDKEDDMPLGYCLAIKHGFYSRNWEISIRRTYPEDFFCADAELRGEQE